ncbi:concanavalin A-like lectin/glucanase domain-containing protein [Polychytrium aggregatum]|uniref:concanavalin A-like lectin/glucanase domain-containing protein n=1 Tax=Polychytrium aggregatum TaxID=110093 RepID=UPI0022FDF0E6|nr:concanavalin A-like lectin/glucanase domain-containing protein [Polychytrium aggregatum]KAI9206794.1 concanavalin A-like lectin/glucanase domain-containing protein [Polychytrium aggregatum]
MSGFSFLGLWIALAAVVLPTATAQSSSDCIKTLSNWGSLPTSMWSVQSPGKITFDNNNAQIYLQKPTSGKYGVGTDLHILQLSLYFGSIEWTVRQSGTPSMITYLTLLNTTTMDEIDIELYGNQPTTTVLTSKPHGSLTSGGRISGTTSSSNVANFHTYRIDWTPYNLTFSVDGTAAGTINKFQTWSNSSAMYQYPSSPSQIIMGVWDGQVEGDLEAGSFDWTTSPQPSYSSEISTLKVSCYTGPFPSQMNAPPSDPRSQDSNGANPNGKSIISSPVGGSSYGYSYTGVSVNPNDVTLVAGVSAGVGVFLMGIAATTLYVFYSYGNKRQRYIEPTNI